MLLVKDRQSTLEIINCRKGKGGKNYCVGRDKCDFVYEEGNAKVSGGDEDRESRTICTCSKISKVVEQLLLME